MERNTSPIAQTQSHFKKGNACTIDQAVVRKQKRKAAPVNKVSNQPSSIEPSISPPYKRWKPDVEESPRSPFLRVVPHFEADLIKIPALPFAVDPHEANLSCSDGHPWEVKSAIIRQVKVQDNTSESAQDLPHQSIQQNDELLKEGCLDAVVKMKGDEDLGDAGDIVKNKFDEARSYWKYEEVSNAEVQSSCDICSKLDEDGDSTCFSFVMQGIFDDKRDFFMELPPLRWPSAHEDSSELAADANCSNGSSETGPQSNSQ